MAKSLKQKEKATFVIEVRYKQHGSWQGIVKWLDSEEEMCFRSTLELLRILDNVQASVCTASRDTEITDRRVINMF